MTSKTKEDNEMLIKLQKEYLATESDKVFSSLWIKATEVTSKIVDVECFKKHLKFNDDYKKEIVDDAVLRVLQRYKKYKKKGQKYELKNFISGLYYGVIWSMYSDWRKRQRQEISLSDIEDENFKKIM